MWSGDSRPCIAMCRRLWWLLEMQLMLEEAVLYRNAACDYCLGTKKAKVWAMGHKTLAHPWWWIDCVLAMPVLCLMCSCRLHYRGVYATSHMRRSGKNQGTRSGNYVSPPLPWAAPAYGGEQMGGGGRKKRYHPQQGDVNVGIHWKLTAGYRGHSALLGSVDEPNIPGLSLWDRCQTTPKIEG